MLHLIAIMLFFGMIAIVDLRLIGLLSAGWPVTRMLREVLPWCVVAFAVAVVTGALLFTSQAKDYYGNAPFGLKLVSLVLAILNILVFHFTTFRGIAEWDRDTAVPFAGRLAGAVSLASWIAVVACGRWIGYSMLPS
jgi:hypothetical protein